MSRIGYLSLLTYSNTYNNIVQEFSKYNLNNYNVLIKLSSRKFEFSDILDRLIEEDNYDTFSELFIYVLGSFYQMSEYINYYNMSNWENYIVDITNRYFNYLCNNLEKFYEIFNSINCLNKDQINRQLLWMYSNKIYDPKLLPQFELLIKLYTETIKDLEKKDYSNQNLHDLKLFINMCKYIKIISGDEESLEFAVENQENTDVLNAFLYYLKLNKKYKEIRMLYFKTRNILLIPENCFWIFVEAFYVDGKYKYVEDLFLFFLVGGTEKIDKKYIEKIYSLFPKLNFERLFQGLSFHAYQNKGYRALKVLSEYSADAKIIYSYLNNTFDVFLLNSEEIAHSKCEVTYTYILLQEAYKSIYKTNSYIEHTNIVEKVLLMLSKTKYNFIAIYSFYCSVESNFYGRVQKMYKEMIEPYLKENNMTDDDINYVTIFKEKITFPYSSLNASLISLFNLSATFYEYHCKNDVVSINCAYCHNKDNKCKHFSNDKINNYLLDKNGYNECIEYYEHLSEISKESILKRESKKVFKNLVDNIKKNEVIRTKEFIHLTPIFEVYSNDTEQEVEMSFKIGMNKSYVIKNISDFVNRVKNNIVFQYGKDLSIEHSLENFDEESLFIIKFLESICVNCDEYDNKISRTIKVSPSFIDELFEKYNYQTVLVKDNGKTLNCVVTTNKFEPNIEIKNDVLKLENNDFELIYGNKYDYICDGSSIKIYDASLDMRKLLRFCYLNPNFNLKYVKNDFLEQVYTRLDNDIKVDEEFKKAVKKVELHIDSYFSMVDNLIQCESLFFIDDVKVDENTLDTNNYKYVKYKTILEKFGFVDNKLTDEQNIMLFLSSNLSELKKISDVYLSDDIKRIQVVKFNKPRPYLGYDTNMLSICIKNFSYSNEELYKILQAIKKKKRFVMLNKDVIIDIDKENAKALLQSINDFSLDEKKLSETQHVPLYYSLKMLNETDEYSQYEMDDFLRKILNDIANYKKSNYKVPSKLDNILRDYQVDGFKWMKVLCSYNFSGILADDMGLGKTLQIIALIMDSTVKKPSLIVCPKSLSYNWLAEFNKWDEDEEVKLIYGLASERSEILSNIKSNEKVIYITSYDSLKNDLDLYKKLNFEFIILDEAQSIKNHTTLKAQSVKQLKSKHKFVLTGTPIENSIIDLWSIFDFLMPNYLYNYNNFKHIYENEIVVNKNASVKDNLVKKITPFILRRTKAEVLKDLPEKIETIQYVTMNEDTKKYYEAELLKLRDMVDDPTKKMQMLASFTRLRQLCVDPSLYIDDYNGSSPKIELIMNLISDYISDNHKIIIFSQFTSAFDKLENLLKDANIDYFILTGKTSASNRVKMADIFNDASSSQKVFLVSLKAGGTGLNLVGADIVIHLDPWWNVAAENQATDRAHRIGQKNVVNVIKIVCLDSIEQKVIELQNMKKEIIANIIADNDDNIQKLSSEDLKILLS